MRTFTFLLTAVTALVAPAAFPASHSDDSDIGADHLSSLHYDTVAKTQAFLNDLSARRRVTTLFANQQSMLFGVQENHVNTSRGNMTFMIRDLIRVGAMPIVMGRVYDSTRVNDEDFGPGWKLAVSEIIKRQGSRLVYTDATNTSYVLRLVGSSIVPTNPAMTPVRSGQLIRFGDDAYTIDDSLRDSSFILLKSDHLHRVFARHGEAYRLMGVAQDEGWLHLAYREGRLAAISSNDGIVKLERRLDGRITAAQDDYGRVVKYQYDELGRLAEVTDLGGQSWHYRYVGNRLAAIDDPRSATILEARYEDHRVASIRTLFNRAEFVYGDLTTSVLDTLGRTTVFYKLPNGVTEGVLDPLGTFTQVTFDESYRPIKVSRNGTEVANLSYDDQGRLSSLRRVGNKASFTYSDVGLVKVLSGDSSASYGYDNDGRIIHAEDRRGQRSYGYRQDGVLQYVLLDGHQTFFDAGPDGIATQILRNGNPLLRIERGPNGRAESIVFGDGLNTVRYEYNLRGFREAMKYDNDVDASVLYDEVGNLMRYTVDTRDGNILSQEYSIGQFNEVLRIRNGAGADVSFRYDYAGRMFAAEAGKRSLNVQFDDLDRAIRVTLDGNVVAEAEYAAVELDAAHQVDRLSTEVTVRAGTSGVFGTMDSIVYTRLRPMGVGPVAYNSELKTFVVDTDYLVPDAEPVNDFETLTIAIY